MKGSVLYHTVLKFHDNEDINLDLTEKTTDNTATLD